MLEFLKSFFEKKKLLPGQSSGFPKSEVSSISDEDRQSLDHAVHQWVWGGFEDLDSIRESATDYLHPAELNSTDLIWIEENISRQWNEKLEAEKSWSDTADFDKLETAFERLQEKNIITLHCAGYTRTDGRDDAVEVWHSMGGRASGIIGYCFYHGQDVEGVIESGELYVAFGSFQKDEQAFEVATLVAAELSAQGLTVVMPPDAETRILISGLVWRKRSPV